jgi:hypothetical protein
MGHEISDDRERLEKPMDRDRSFPCLCPIDPAGHLYDECDRVVELQPAESYEKSTSLSNKRCGYKTAIHGFAKYIKEMDYAYQELEPISKSAGY